MYERERERERERKRTGLRLTLYFSVLSHDHMVQMHV